jgi:hypothetical protein
VQTWRKPSPEGKRIALDRKWRHNVDHYGGATKLLTLTPAGEDLLPFGDETRWVGPEECRLVDYVYREVWNFSAQARASRLMEAAQRHADRWVRKLGWSGPLPRQVGNVRAEQKRGVWHFHYLLPYETEIERAWSRMVDRFMQRAWRNDRERWPDESQRRELLWREYQTGEVTRGFYGFGYVHGGKPQGRTAATSARYMARNSAGYMARNVAGRGRHYVSARLTSETGITMRALRACNWLHVRRKMIDSGELEDEWIPGYWDDDWRSRVLAVYALVTSPRAP